MRFQRTKALLYSAVLGAVLSGCTNSVIAADQVTPIVVPATCTSANSSMNVVAHEDDDILFIDSPTYLDVTSGRCLTTVYLTAGDDGQGASYWQGREDGAMAAYAMMARTGNAWTTTELPTSSGQVAVTRTLNGTDIRLIFLRLPTGSPGGRVTYQHECLGRLRAGTSPLVHAVDATANYTSDSLRATLTGFMMTFHPGVVRTLDYSERASCDPKRGRNVLKDLRLELVRHVEHDAPVRCVQSRHLAQARGLHAALGYRERHCLHPHGKHFGPQQ